jgi:dipeptidyl aminopeptidase/acylaminoacyl peptidase
LPGASGDISLPAGAESSAHLAWSKKRGGPYMLTPSLYGPYLYTCSNSGTVTAYEAKTGKQIYQKRLGGSSGYSASPVAADGKLYFTGEDGTIRVVKAGPQFELLAANPMGDVCMATPAISDGMIFVRTQHFLFGIGIQPAGAQPAAKAKSAPPRRFELGDLAKLVDISDPQFSPDGRSIVMVVSRPNYDKNRHDSELVLVDVAIGTQRVLTFQREDVDQPRWSPTGDRLAFLAKPSTGEETEPQLFIMPMNGGDARQVTKAPTAVQHYAWKPNGKEIAFATADEPANKKAKENHDDAFEVGNNDYLASKAPTATHLWLVAAEGGAARRLTSGSWSLATAAPPGPPIAPLAWSPDGKSIAFVRQERPHDGDNDLTTVQIIDVAAGTIRALTDRKALEYYPSFAPDGTQLAYWYPRDGDPNSVIEIWAAPAAGGKGKCLTRELDRNLYLSLWLPDGKSLLVGGDDGQRVSLWVQPLQGPARRLDLGRISPTWFYHMDVSIAANGAVAFVGSDPQCPAELFYLASPQSAPRRLTDFNRHVAGLHLGKVETITWQGPDGFQENGILTFPPDFKPEKKYPLVLLIHGGPQSASTEVFSKLAQLIAAHDYVVFQPNYRGSDNLGNAYQRAIVKDWGKGPGRDVMAGLEAVKKRGFVDASRIAVTGWSYGGYMTTWLIGNYQGWKTAIAGAAVTDLIDDYNLSDSNVQGRYLFGGSPWTGEFAKLFREQSPITYAHQIRTPTLILATTGDARVPITQSYRLYHALKDNGVPVKFVAYPVSGHYPDDPVRQKDLYRRWVAWLDQYLR